MQKFLTLCMTILIIYLVVTHSETLRKVKKEESNNSHKEESHEPEKVNHDGSFMERTLSSVIHNIMKTEEGRIFFENLIKPTDQALAGQHAIKMNNVDFLNSLLKIHSFGKGTGGAASCGHVATIDYKIFTMNNILIKEGSDTLALGSNKIAPGLEVIVVGMKPGETRHATIPTKYFSQEPKHQQAYFKIQVTLKHLVPNNFVEDAQIFDDQISYQLPLVCGVKTSYDLKITDLAKNKIIYNSLNGDQRINMKIGDMNYPVIFSHALHNKIPIGTRTVISKGKYMKSYISDYSRIFPKQKFPQDSLYLIEFSNFRQAKSLK